MPRKSIFDSRHVELVARLRAARERCGFTQAQLAARLGMPQSYVAKIEKGQRRVDVVELMDLAAALSIRPTALIPLPTPDEKDTSRG